MVNACLARKTLEFSLTFLLKFQCSAAQILDKLKLKCHIFQSPLFDTFLTSLKVILVFVQAGPLLLHFVHYFTIQ